MMFLYNINCIKNIYVVQEIYTYEDLEHTLSCLVSIHYLHLTIKFKGLMFSS